MRIWIAIAGVVACRGGAPAGEADPAPIEHPAASERIQVSERVAKAVKIVNLPQAPGTSDNTAAGVRK